LSNRRQAFNIDFSLWFEACVGARACGAPEIWKDILGFWVIEYRMALVPVSVLPGPFPDM
jgi:hypothetical protein